MQLPAKLDESESSHSFSREAFQNNSQQKCKWEFVAKRTVRTMAELRPKMRLLESTSLFNQIKHYHRDVYCARFCFNLIKLMEVIHLNPGCHTIVQSDSCYYVCKGSVKVTVQKTYHEEPSSVNMRDGTEELISKFTKYKTQKTYKAQNTLSPDCRMTFKIHQNDTQKSIKWHESIEGGFTPGRSKIRHSTTAKLSPKMVNFNEGVMKEEDQLISQKALLLHKQKIPLTASSVLLSSDSYTLLLGLSAEAIQIARSS